MIIAVIANPVAANPPDRARKPQSACPGAMPNSAPQAMKTPTNAVSTATAAMTASTHPAQIRRTVLTSDKKTVPVTAAAADKPASSTPIAAPPTQNDRFASGPIGPSFGPREGSDCAQAWNTHKLSPAPATAQHQTKAGHARLSTWLNANVAPLQVAEWASKQP